MTFYTVTEPHPTVAENHYTHAGRGGSGNYFRAPATTPASGLAEPIIAPTPTTTTTTAATAPTRFYSGRGGAGNSHVGAPKPPAMSFDEEYRRQAHIESKPVGHVGRGGAGNVYDRTHTHHHDEKKTTARRASSASSGSSSSGSGSSGFLGRLSKTLSRNH